MYGWKMSGGGGGKPDKKLLAYGKSTVFSDLIREHSTRALNAEYHMEERTDLYDCGKTDFFVIPTGYHGFDETPNFASHFTLPWKDIFEDGAKPNPELNALLDEANIVLINGRSKDRNNKNKPAKKSEKYFFDKFGFKHNKVKCVISSSCAAPGSIQNKAEEWKMAIKELMPGI